jgi:hypothetical protein
VRYNGRMTTITKQDKIDAAVSIVQEHAQAVMDGTSQSTEYMPGYAVAGMLEDRGVLVREPKPGDYNASEKARLRVENQAKRLLDEEAAKPDARILRFSSVDSPPLPRLDGTMRRLPGSQVAYTTAECYERCQRAVENRDADQKAKREEMAAWLKRAQTAGLPEPSSTVEGATVTYNLDTFAALVRAAMHSNLPSCVECPECGSEVDTRTARAL